VNPDLAGKNVLVTGATGSFGHAFVRRLLDEHEPARIVIFSRDEWKQGEMAREFDCDHRLRFYLGDVRDIERLRLALHRVSVVVHAAAMKQVPACERDPTEAVATNVVGAMNVVRSALDEDVERVVALSSDKACAPVNLYGATKLCAERLFVAANSYAGGRNTRFSVVRYGNIAGSRGSVIPLFRDCIARGESVPVTDERMTRFWMTQQGAVDLVLRALSEMRGGEIFIPDLRGFRLVDLVAALGGRETRRVGIRPGEKLHESLIATDETRAAWCTAEGFCIGQTPAGAPPSEDWRYRSDLVPQMGVDELRAALAEVQ
jgi:UDP-N-acetylglucosamine 4,6-dehydratase